MPRELELITIDIDTDYDQHDDSATAPRPSPLAPYPCLAHQHRAGPLHPLRRPLRRNLRPPPAPDLAGPLG